jgi:hypothetical protein
MQDPDRPLSRAIAHFQILHHLMAYVARLSCDFKDGTLLTRLPLLAGCRSRNFLNMLECELKGRHYTRGVWYQGAFR